MFEGSISLDDEVVHDSALVIDSNATSRGVAVQNLRSFGFGNVRQASRMVDGRNMLEFKPFNLVVCDLHFDNESTSGISLLEELRRENLMPYSTVFVLIASEATYNQVAEAAESALDGYILKPYSANSLGDRVKEARQRKRVLRNIFEALEQRDFELAAQLSLERFESRGLYWLYAARIGAELLLRQKRNEEATRLFEAVVAAKTVPWARLGIARAHFAEGDIGKARRQVEELLAEDPSNADAYDVLGSVQMEMGELAQARSTFETATQLTPDCILRLQHTGTLSFYSADHARAADLLQRAWSIGKRSRLFDFLSMLLLAFIRYETGQLSALELAKENLQKALEAHPQSVRLRRFLKITEVLWDAANGRQQPAFRQVREICSDAMRPAFDLEAAMNVLAMSSRMVPVGFPIDEFENIVRRIGRRFSVSRAANQVLLSAALRRPDVDGWLAECLAETSRVAQNGVDLALKDSPKRAIEMLLQNGDVTYNSRIIELAGQLLKRHRDKIEDAHRLVDMQGVLARRFCIPSTHIAGIRRSGRSSGGLLLRT